MNSKDYNSKRKATAVEMAIMGKIYWIYMGILKSNSSNIRMLLRVNNLDKTMTDGKENN